MDLTQLAGVLARTFDPNLRVEAEKRLNEVMLIGCDFEMRKHVCQWHQDVQVCVFLRLLYFTRCSSRVKSLYEDLALLS